MLSSFVTAAEASQERGLNSVVVGVPFFEHCEHHYRYKLHVNFLGFLKDCLNRTVVVIVLYLTLENGASVSAIIEKCCQPLSLHVSDC